MGDRYRRQADLVPADRLYGVRAMVVGVGAVGVAATVRETAVGASAGTVQPTRSHRTDAMPMSRGSNLLVFIRSLVVPWLFPSLR